MEIDIFGTYYALFMLFLIVFILVLNLVIRMKYLKIFDIIVKYPKLEKEMLIFRRFRNPYGFIPFAHPDYFIPIVNSLRMDTKNILIPILIKNSSARCRFRFYLMKTL